MREKRCKVLIVGAGIAGLTAAKTLVEEDLHDFLIIEPRDYLGGRVAAVEFADHTFPIGPAFLHGLKLNPLAEIAKDLGLLSYPDHFSKSCDNNKYKLICRSLVTGSEVTANYRQARGKFDVANKDLMDLYSRMDSISLMEDSFFNDDNDEVLEKSLESCGWKSATAAERLVENLFIDIASGGSASHFSTKAYLAFDALYELDDVPRDSYLLDGEAFKKCVHEIARRANLFSTNEEKLLLNVSCKCIDYSSGDSVLVTLSDGQLIHANHVIVTVPCHLLLPQNGPMINFVPPLTEQKISAFSKVRYSNYQRIFVQFESVFWDDDHSVILVANDTEEALKQDFSDPLHPSKFCCYWQNAHYLYRLSGVAEPPKVLIAHVTGDWATKTLQMTKQELISKLLKFFSSLYKTQVEIKDVLVASWAQDPYARGSFAYFTAPLKRQDVDALKRSIDNRIHFAGDAFDLRCAGASQSAYFSGIRAAENASI
ncbi:hypothetical protein Ciccas_009726 [Cichlidogyrus casuarinus]|uniref:Amine oxidase domain-containing protein n=1 Tax=Cichlidogyrus casuarinus TaxID=1844966 RepID=A0ABD2PW99_9PLAT